MADYTLSARVTADTSGFTSAMKTAQQSLKTFSDKCSGIGDVISSLGDTMSKIGTYATAIETAVAGITVAGITEATEAAIDWESAFAGVTKTVDGTDAQLQAISDGIKQMATETASSSTEIAAVAEAAGQLGIATDDILDFTKVMVELGDATNLSADEAASALAKMANITGLDSSEYENLGSAIVDLGNNFATTESDIVAMSTRLASTATLVGMSETDILGLATAMSSVGIEAEAGGSSMSTVLKKMQSYCSTGGEELDTLASVAGMTADEFKTAFEEDAAGALEAFITGLGDVQDSGGDTLSILNTLSLTDIRVSNTVLALASGSDTLTDALDTSAEAWENNTALSAEAETRYSTTESIISQTKETINNLAIEIGEHFTPYVQTACEYIQELADVITTGLNAGGVQGAFGALTGYLQELAAQEVIPQWVADLVEELPAKVEAIKTNLETLGDKISEIAGYFGIEIDGGLLTGLAGVAATGPGLSVVGTVLSKFGGFISTFGKLASNASILGGVLGAVAAAGILIYSAFTDTGMQDVLTEISGTFLTFCETLGEFLFSSEGIVAILSEGLSPVLSALIGVVSGLLEGITSVMEFLMEHQTLLTVLVDLIAAIVVGITAWEAVTNAIKIATAAYQAVQLLLNTTMAACPIVWIIAIIAALVAAFVLLWNNCDGFRQFWIDLWDNIKSIVSTVVDAIKEFFSGLWDKIKEIASGIKEDFTTKINAIKTICQTVVDKIKSIWQGIKDTVSSVFNAIKTKIQTIMNSIKTIFTTVIDKIKSAWNGITDFVGGIFDGIKSAFNTVVDWIKSFINGFIDKINLVIGVINLIPGVDISELDHLSHGTDNWSGGFAMINEGGKGELVNLPDGSQVIPHDLSEKYAKEAAQANGGISAVGIDYEALAAAVMAGMCGADVHVTTEIDGKTVADQITSFVDRNLGRRQTAAARA